MKRYAFLLILLLPAAGVFALDLGFGVSGGYILNDMTISLASPAVSSETRFTHVPFGASVYADVDFYMLSFGYTQLILSHELWTQTTSGTTTTLVDEGTGTGGYLGLTLLGKYPFVLGSLTFSPLLGFGVDINVLLLDVAGNDLRAAMTDEQKSEQNQFWLKAGAALDVALSEKAYLRSEALFSCKLPTSGEQKAYLTAQQAGFDVLLFEIMPELDLFLGFKL
jgi:hypothetical protein